MPNQSTYRITATLGGIDVPVTRLHLTEGLSSSFHAVLDIYDSGFRQDPITFKQLLDGHAIITLWDKEVPIRYIHGHVHKLEAGEAGVRRRYYTATIVPAMDALQLTTDCRIFQNQTVEEIVALLFKEHQVFFFDFGLKSPRASRTYCVQYNESVYDFIHRLLAEEGIWYYYEHTLGYHKIHFRDGVELLEQIDPLNYKTASAHRTEASIWQVHYAEQRVITRTTQRDRTFQNPNNELEETYHGLYIENQLIDRYHAYHYPGRYKKKEQGLPFTQYRQQAAQNEQRVATFEHDYVHLKEGVRFDLQNHPVEERNQTWVTTHNILHVEQPQASEEDAQANYNSGVPIPPEYASQFKLTTHAIPYPQQYSPPPWPKPVVEGPQIADVVGPPSQEIFCDEYGRVAVKFPWDRYAKGDHTSSCWVRVAQNWAGAMWGSIAIPRIGHEVLVGYDNGDPDQPIIIGRTYSANNLPPYTLALHKTRMVIKSKTHMGVGHNELYFDDKTDNEEVYLHAQKDQNNIVKNDETTEIGNDRTEHVTHDEKITIDNDKTIQVDGAHTETIKKDAEVTITEGNYTHAVQMGSETRTAMQEVSIESEASEVYIKASTMITLEVGASKLVMDAAGNIELSGVNVAVSGGATIVESAPAIVSEGTASHTTKGAVVTSTADATNTITGAIVTINP